MQLFVEPDNRHWRPANVGSPHRATFAALAQQHADRLGAATITTHQPLFATGHQAWLWHPGILAKLLATKSAATAHHAGWFHLVVDTDVNEALTLPLPLQHDQRLMLEKIVLGVQRKLIPTGAHAPVDVQAMRQSVLQALETWRDALSVDLAPLLQAIDHLAEVTCHTLAEQMTVLVQSMTQPWLGRWPVVFESQLSGWSYFHELLHQMRDDPKRCVQAYNQATQTHPGAGIPALRCDEQRIELPLWLMQRDKPRLRVFIQGTGTRAILIDEQRRTLDLPTLLTTDASLRLVPRALLLTAMLRSAGCDLFVHGRGGEHYDPVMEQWWADWQGSPLAPRVMVSADVTLDFAVPVAAPADLQRAIWWAHHLPHNVDRALQLHNGIANQKRVLLQQLATSTDRSEKARAFAQLHQLNTQLADDFAPLIQTSLTQVQQAQIGVANRGLARKRDWPVCWYPTATLQALANRLREGVSALSSPDAQPENTP